MCRWLDFGLYWKIGQKKHKEGECFKMRKAKPSGKRILASILAVGMIAGLVPSSALADDAAPTSTQQSAVVQSEEQETQTEDEGTNVRSGAGSDPRSHRRIGDRAHPDGHDGRGGGDL